MAAWKLVLPGLLAVAPAVAAPPPMVVPGGTLDSRFTGAEVYVGRPEPATPPPGKACAAASAYVGHINAGRYREAANLFADDGLLLEPMRTTYRGLAEIRTFYEGRIGPMKPEVVPVAFVGNDRDCMLEMASLSTIGGEKRFALVSVNHFTVNAAGKVIRMIAFARPPRTQ